MKTNSPLFQSISLPDLLICGRQLTRLAYNYTKNLYETEVTIELDKQYHHGLTREVVCLENFIFVSEIDSHNGREGEDLWIDQFTKNLEKIATLKLPGITSFATDGEMLFISSEGHLVSINQYLDILHKVPLNLNNYSLKDVHDILIYEKTAYLLDNIVYPIYILRADITDPTQLKITSTIQVEDIYPHLLGQWLNPSLNQWCIIQSYSHRGGGGKNILIYPLNEGNEQITSQPLLNYSYGLLDAQEQRGIEIIAMTKLPPIWAIIRDESKRILLAEVNSQDHKINFEKKIDLRNAIEDYVSLSNSEVYAKRNIISATIRHQNNYLFILFYLNVNYYQNGKLIVIELQEETPQIVIEQTLNLENIKSFELLSNPNNVQEKQPALDDAVLGGQSPPLIHAAVLGGIAAVKRNLASRSSKVRIQALSEAIKYEPEGIKLIEQIVKTETGAVQRAAYNLLWEREDEALKKELLEYFPLESALGINYGKLRDLIAAEAWEEANEETYRVMRQIAGEYAWNIHYFPCEDLRTIDQLWVKSSCDRFGFSVQKRIYQTLGGSWKDPEKRGNRLSRLKNWNVHRKNQRKIWEELGDRIGWRQHGNWIAPSDLNFSITAPAGHLPVWWRQNEAPDRDYFLPLASRIDTCRIS